MPTASGRTTKPQSIVAAVLLFFYNVGKIYILATPLLSLYQIFIVLANVQAHFFVFFRNAQWLNEVSNFQNYQ